MSPHFTATIPMRETNSQSCRQDLALAFKMTMRDLIVRSSQYQLQGRRNTVGPFNPINFSTPASSDKPFYRPIANDFAIR